MDYDEELHTAWVTKALHLAMEYREAEPGREVRDAMRAMKAHFEGRPASMPMQDTVAYDMDEVAKQYAHKLAMNLECLVLECPPSARFFDEANTTLGEYRSAMNKIHERECPTHMGEPLLKGQGADSTAKAHAIYEKWTGKHS
jgi:hypothetical protein